jgi:hypothetical protein
MTGKPFAAQNSEKLYEEIVDEILRGTIYLDKMTAGITDAVAVATRQCIVFQYHSSIISKSLVSAIEQSLQHLELLDMDLLNWSLAEPKGSRPSATRNAKLAVVGMSCRLPGGADNPELFWKLMEQGRDVHTTVPADRFDLKSHFDPTGKVPNATETPYGNFIDNPGFFDAGFFNMSPKEVCTICFVMKSLLTPHFRLSRQILCIVWRWSLPTKL